jgi:hypothetical protein
MIFYFMEQASRKTIFVQKPLKKERTSSKLIYLNVISANSCIECSESADRTGAHNYNLLSFSLVCHDENLEVKVSYRVEGFSRALFYCPEQESSFPYFKVSLTPHAAKYSKELMMGVLNYSPTFSNVSCERTIFTVSIMSTGILISLLRKHDNILYSTSAVARRILSRAVEPINRLGKTEIHI